MDGKAFIPLKSYTASKAISEKGNIPAKDALTRNT